MRKPGLVFDIPGFGLRHIAVMLTDYTGTLSCGGRLGDGIGELIAQLAESLDIHVLTADTYGLAESELKGLPVTIQRLTGGQTDLQKQEYGERIGLNHCVVLGNGNNDRLLLKAAKEAGGIAIAIDNGEGCATDALLSSNIFVGSALSALNLLLRRTGCIATLRV